MFLDVFKTSFLVAETLNLVVPKANKLKDALFDDLILEFVMFARSTLLFKAFLISRLIANEKSLLTDRAS